MNQNIIISVQDLKAVIISIMADEKLLKVMQRPQLILTEACHLYGDNRIKKYIKAGLLKPVSQNGKGSAIYYSHKKIIELTQMSFHHLNDIDL